MKKYFKYLIYILEHKKNVFMECIKDGLYIHAFTHDMSKFSPVEFISYAKQFKGNEKDKENSGFEYGWLHHQHKNKHHWNYWVNGDGTPVEMPDKYVRQMICDWKAMSRKFGDTAYDYYENNRYKMKLHPSTKYKIEEMFYQELKERIKKKYK